MRYPETAQLIKSARRKRGWSQERAAQVLGCSRLQFIRWEQGLHRPDPDGLGAALVDLLGVDAKKLASADEDEEAALQPIAKDLFSAVSRIVAYQREHA